MLPISAQRNPGFRKNGLATFVDRRKAEQREKDKAAIAEYLLSGEGNDKPADDVAEDILRLLGR